MGPLHRKTAARWQQALKSLSERKGQGQTMLGMGMQDILIILVVALIVIGPKRLPELAKTLGKGLAEFKKAADDLQETVRQDLEVEKHKDLVKKYPDLIPKDEGGGKSDGQAAASTAPEAPPENKDPSSPLDEIEGGDFDDEGKDA